MKQAEILIIGVIYNTYRETLRYLESLAQADPEKVVLILADNSTVERPEGFAAKATSYPFVHYFETGGNLGYFGGARAALARYLEHHPVYPPWILVTNVDIVFTPGFTAYLGSMKPGQAVGMVAPAILSQRWNTDNNPQLMNRPSRCKLQFLRIVFSNFALHSLYHLASMVKAWGTGFLRNGRRAGRSPVEEAARIYAPHGSCLIFRDEYFVRGGSLEMPNFLFGEEIMVAETLVRLRLSAEYRPDLIIHDYEHASTGLLLSRSMSRYQKEYVKAILMQYYRG